MSGIANMANITHSAVAQQYDTNKWKKGMTAK
jgi:hypothetical protein